MDELQHAIPKMYIINQDTAETVVAQFNPSAFTEEVGAEWATLVVPGMSHKPRQFIATENPTFDLTLRFQAETLRELEQMRTVRRRIQSWVYPKNVGRAQAGSGAAAFSQSRVLSAAPPSLWMEWPSMIHMETILLNAKFSHRQFTASGETKRFDVTLEIEELRRFKISSEDVSTDLDGRLEDSFLVGEVR